MIRTGLSALVSHWLRHPAQLAMLLIGLALATALWSGVQAINSEARAAYARAATLLGQDRLDRLVAAEGGTISQDIYLRLRRDGWLVSPMLEGRLRPSALRVVGIEPLTLPPEAAASGAVNLGSGDLSGFLGGTRGIAHPDTIVGPGPRALLPDLQLDLSVDLPPGMLLVDIGSAQRLLGQVGRISALIVAPGRQPAGPLPKGLVLRRSDGEASLARLTDSFHLNLSAFGFLAFAVGIFIVHSAIGLAFEQRRPMLRTLRALGLPVGTLTALLVAELLLLSGVAGLMGVALGYLVAAALLPDVAATLSGLYGATVPGELTIRAEWWGAGLAIAVFGTLAAAGRSLWQVWHLPLLVPAQPRAWALASASGRRLQMRVAAGILAAAGAFLGFGSGLWAGFGGLAGLLLGAALALPSLLDLIVRAARKCRSGPIWEWFWADTRQQLPGLSLALMALMLALAANIGVGTMVSSFRTTFVGWMDQRLASELYLTTRTPDEAARITAWLAPRTDAILPIVSAEVALQGQPGNLYGVADHSTYRDHWPLLAAVDGVWDRVASGTGLLINEQLARRSRIGLGDPVGLPDGPLPVVGIYSDYGNPAAQAIIGLASFTLRFPDLEPLRFGLRLPSDRAERLSRELRETFELAEEALVDQAGIKAFSLQVFDRTFTVTAALNLLTLGVASLAMFASLLTLAMLRLPQLAPVWAMGLTRRHLAALDFLRTLILAAAACVAALPLGLALAWVLLAVVNVEAFGWRLPMRFYPGDWLILLLTALAATALAALVPTLQMARRTPGDLLRIFANER